MTQAPLLLATRSTGKLGELRPMFAAAGIGAIDLDEAGIPESGDEDGVEAHESFDANARAKAAFFHASSGLTTVADDSGLEVFALGGAPGVRSKRWSGRTDLAGAALDEANNAFLMDRLAGAVDRRARYVCVASLVGHGLAESARGEVVGELLASPRGSGGFGYDPYFVPVEGDGRTFGEMARLEKAHISHRGRAFAALLRWIAETRGRD